MAAFDFPAIVQAEKQVAIKPQWEATDSTWFKLACALDIGGGTVPGLELRGMAHQTLPDRHVTFHLQHHPSRGECVHLARIDWRPLGFHNNPDCGPKHLRLARIDCSHIHRFENNWLADWEKPRKSLPIAEVINPDPSGFDELVALVGKEFRISGLDRLERPDWRMADLFGV
jgi:hypothetical protein